MKHKPNEIADDLSGKAYWRSLRELENHPELAEALANEFPEGATLPPDGVSRRTFLSLMGASFGLAGLVGCRRPDEKILPYARAPEQIIPGKPLFFATAMPFHGTALGLLVESHEGRPTKIEGNPRHPESLGSSNLYAQASVLDLYDPDRSDSPRRSDVKETWGAAAAFLEGLGSKTRERGGQGLAILTEAHRSPTLAAALAELKQQLPQARVFRYEPFNRDNAREGAKLALGRPLESILDVAKARIILALDADILHADGSPIKQLRGYAEGRKVEGKDASRINRLYAVESKFSITGTAADHRLRMASRDVVGFAGALVRELSAHGVNVGAEVLAASEAQPQPLAEKAKKWVSAVAKDLAGHRGQSLVVVGAKQPPVVHALACLINHALGNVGQTIAHVQAFDEAPEGARGIVDLVNAIRGGAVDTLIILGGNPVFNAPHDVKFAEALGSVRQTIHLSTHFDDTSQASKWHLNRAHYLESWSDVRSEDGTASIIQPLIAPLLDGRTDAEVVHMLLGKPLKAHDLVRSTWQKVVALDFEKAWRRALHDGAWEGSAYRREDVTPTGGPVAEAWRAQAVPAGGYEIVFHPDHHAWDGRFANNGWLQELPEPMTKLTWGNVALLSPATAKKLGVGDGDVVSLGLPGAASVALPVIVAPGHADDSIAVSIGQGRSAVGRVGTNVGVSTAPLRSSAAFFIAGGATVKKTGQSVELARTQEHFAMEGRPLVREAGVDAFHSDPEFAKKAVKHPELLNLWQEYKYDGHKWGMTIDLNACVGCGACTVACQAENNIPLVGPEGVKKSREMHWIRLDRYFEGSLEDPRSVSQPMSCSHCENAPCEQVCPVGATAHSPEGLNDMAYNRCVGTRYCANNCPFKVRRFNYFDYTKKTPEIGRMQFNPDVTVRMRGVMEKCTYCVQRINHAKIEAKNEGHERVADGRITTACQQACPAKAIAFGDLNDKNSEVTRKAWDPRSYVLLAELNIRPRTSYLARIRNPNPELERA
ncbi:MAG: TAT-variant-translocated molybdopterin oxidoreductase [Deltaproteobacteria bacterium]|nr:TAT-variant-translocated molybdopterin oxidoreductase [Deltaproteobacteria bacterium]